MSNLASLDKPLIYLITDGKTTGRNFAENKKNILRFVEIAVASKIALIQIREKLIPARMLYELAVEAVAVAADSATKILINDRADIALAANADGVHLTAASLSARIIRDNFPDDFIVGVSAHTFEKAVAASEQGADFVAFSPIYQSPGKAAPQGIEKLREVCERLKPFPVIALGGVNETNYEETLRAGASGFAAIRFLNNDANLRKLSQKFNLKSNI